jgi:serine/threonine protein kinase
MHDSEMVSQRSSCEKEESSPTTTAAYSMICKIDEGSFSEVFTVRSCHDSRTYALKRILYRGNVDDDPYIPGEISSLSILDHVNIIRLKEVVVGKHEVDIVMEYADGGNLECFLQKNFPLADDILHNLFRQILSGVAHCHSHYIAHRDLTPSNLLLTRDNVVKLADFGLAMRCNDNPETPTLCDDYLGNNSYLPHEVLKERPYLPLPADVWSLGIVLFYMLTKDVPFKGEPEDMAEEQEHRGVVFPPSVGVKRTGAVCRTIRVVKMMLQTNPATRPTADTVLQTWMSYGEYYKVQCSIASSQYCRVNGSNSNDGQFAADAGIVIQSK